MTKGISSSFFSLPMSMLVGSLKNVLGQVTGRWEAPAERMQILHTAASLWYKRKKEKTDHGRQRLKYIRRRSYRAPAIW